jgi:hypothetical protein
LGAGKKRDLALRLLILGAEVKRVANEGRGFDKNIIDKKIFLSVMFLSKKKQPSAFVV